MMTLWHWGFRRSHFLPQGAAVDALNFYWTEVEKQC